MSHVATTDLCDSHEDRLATGTLEVFDPGYLAFGKKPAFAGPAATVKVFEDNALVRTLLETPGAGRVLVVDGGGSRRCALVGGKLAELAAANGWAGIVVYGTVRDRTELERAEIGIRALGLQPRRSAKLGAGTLEAVVRFSGVSVRPGDWIYADVDGILVSREPLAG